mmetsp:Transcript_11783/g.19856  ORF Transcript_11783/g.19856 Transcript_11783/m.19856 type:complete len:200 (+) Transcript_11783:158-757(+)
MPNVHFPRCGTEDFKNGSWVLSPASLSILQCCKQGSGTCLGLPVLENLRDQHMFQGMKHVMFVDCCNACCYNFKDAYRWRPSNCRLDTWNAQHFCHALGKRRLLFIGDSTMLQLATIAMNALNALNGSCVDQIYFGHSGTLVARALGRHNTGVHWTKHVDALKPDIVLMNAGAHIWGEAAFRQVLDEVASDLHRPAHIW